MAASDRSSGVYLALDDAGNRHCPHIAQLACLHRSVLHGDFLFYRHIWDSFHRPASWENRPADARARAFPALRHLFHDSAIKLLRHSGVRNSQSSGCALELLVFGAAVRDGLHGRVSRGRLPRVRAQTTELSMRASIPGFFFLLTISLSL